MSNRIVDLSEINDPAFEQAFIFFCRHLVSLSGSVQPIVDDAPAGEEQHFTFSGFLISIRGVWHVVTAGHILEPFEKCLTEKKVKLTGCYLLDDFGPNSISNVPIPFDYENAPKIYIDDDNAGLDFGLIVLDPHYERLLKANGTVPVTEDDWVHQHKIDFDSYFIVGLPTKLLSDPGNNELTQRMAVTIIPAQKDSSSSQIRQTAYSRLVVKIDDGHPLDLFDGLSGGPILGFSSEKWGRYWVVAVQSSMIRSERLAFGCPIPVIGNLVEQWIDKAGDDTYNDES